MMDIFDTLRLKRHEHRLSQREVAERLGVPSVRVSWWETRAHMPSIKELYAWANALGIDLVAVPREVR